TVLLLASAAKGLGAGGWGLGALALSEAALGCWLLTGWKPEVSARIALATFAAFFAVAAWSAWTATPCGCFGAVVIHPALIAVFDAVAVTALAVDPSTKLLHLAPRARMMAASALWLAVAGLLVDAGIRSMREAIDTRPTVLISPKDDLGGRLRWLPMVEGSEPLSEGEWLVAITRRGCPACQGLLGECSARPGSSRLRLAVIEIPSDSGAGDGSGMRAALVLRAPASKRWAGELPAVVRLDKGTVTGVALSLAVLDEEGR
ncbi:MAG: hypothetical protein K2W96_13090, partial [Gemmataceae bacterium]|nr:hypothetical protein [Gemmataceae bacterium]